MGVSTAVTMDTKMLSSVHAQTPTCTAVYQFKWVDQGVVYPFDYQAYQFSGMAQEQRCPDNRGSTVLEKKGPM